MEADEVIARLGLAPHPEGGHYREYYRHRPVGGGRGAATAIHYLLKAGERSRWHRVDADELWLHHAGAPLELRIAGERPGTEIVLLAGGLADGGQPHGLVPAQAWQSAVSLGAWSLVSCVVAPAFELSGFELAPAGWAPR